MGVRGGRGSFGGEDDRIYTRDVFREVLLIGVEEIVWGFF